MAKLLSVFLRGATLMESLEICKGESDRVDKGMDNKQVLKGLIAIYCWR
jgi:hypothetical protein